jgi:hypothetical protein
VNLPWTKTAQNPGVLQSQSEHAETTALLLPFLALLVLLHCCCVMMVAHTDTAVTQLAD